MSIRYFAHYNVKNGRLIGIYDTGAYQYIPTPSIEITYEGNAEAQDWLLKGYEVYVVDDHLVWRCIYMNDVTSAKKSKLQEINFKADYALYYIVRDYPDSEMTSWYKQEMEARLYRLNPVNHPSILLESIATARGIPIDELINRVIEKSNMFSALSGTVFGRRQKYEDDLALAVTLQDVERIEPDFSDIIKMVAESTGQVTG